MKTIREFLEEQINEQLIQAVVSGRRTGEGPSKVKLRPVELKGQIFYQASMTCSINPACWASCSLK